MQLDGNRSATAQLHVDLMEETYVETLAYRQKAEGIQVGEKEEAYKSAKREA